MSQSNSTSISHVQPSQDTGTHHMPVVASASAPAIMVEDSPFQSFTQPFNQDVGRLRVDEQLISELQHVWL